MKGNTTMKAFTRGVIVGLGVGLLFAPMKGEDLRRLLSARVAEMRNSLPADANQYAQQVGERVSVTGEHLRGYAQQAVSKVKDTGSTLGTLAQRSAHEVKQTGQDLVEVTRATAGAEQSDASTPE